MTRVACFIGDGSFLAPDPARKETWVNQLQKAALNSGNLKLLTLASENRTSADIAASWRREVAEMAGKDEPACMVFCFGANDMCEDIDGVRVSLFDSLQNAETILTGAKADYPVVWIGPMPVKATCGDPSMRLPVTNERLVSLNAAYASLAKSTGVPYLDLFSMLLNDPDWQQALTDGNGLHPGRKGHDMLASIVSEWEDLRTALGTGAGKTADPEKPDLRPYEFREF